MAKRKKTVTEKRWQEWTFDLILDRYIPGRVFEVGVTRKQAAEIAGVHLSWIGRVTLTYEVPRG